MSEEIRFTQSAVIPYRIKDKELQILLITSIRRKKWIIPKGFIEFNFTAFESAKKEAYEEAGAIGTNETKELGFFISDKYDGDTKIIVYSMEVEKLKEEYPEMNMRKRKWFPAEEAIEKVTIPEVAEMIKKLAAGFSSNIKTN